MKTQQQVTWLAVTIAALGFASTGWSQQQITRNRAEAASPRYLENHLELVHKPASLREADTQAARLQQQLEKKIQNRALAASPRFLEEHPELLRPALSAQEAQAQAMRQREQVVRIARNRAAASSPRTLEHYPELVRRDAESQATYQVAPLK